jgi:uncharacterized BrkB/YihY/UPF0761 family membrane protein
VVPESDESAERAEVAGTGLVARLWARGTGLADRCLGWVERQDPASRKGAAVGSFRRYQAADGQLFALLLTANLFVTVLPVVVVTSGYLDRDPSAAADRMIRRLGLTGSTASLMHEVLSGAAQNKLGATLIAVGSAVLFGLGFGRILQITHARSWGIDLGKSRLTDQARYLAVLVTFLTLLVLFTVQGRLLDGRAAWIGWALGLFWVATLLGFFTWAPRMLLHSRVTARDVFPGAVFTVLAFVAVRLLSSLLFTNWLVWYSKYYGALGITMAVFFWLLVSASIVTIGAALSPALAERRDMREAASHASR